ncbi:MAG: 4-hydroxythreonine-4-phosphate dehydrogenase PdxA, partial [Marinilabiliaceae bacterium]
MKIGITQGDVNGIGYEVIMKALQDMEVIEDLTPIIYGSPKAAAYHRKALNVAGFSLNNINDADEAHPKRINIVTCGDDNIKVELGKSSEAAGQAAFAALEAAVRDLSDGKIDAVVTAPINKKNIQSENFHFPGHTEYLEQAPQAPALMLLVAGKLRVGVV